MASETAFRSFLDLLYSCNDLQQIIDSFNQIQPNPSQMGEILSVLVCLPQNDMLDYILVKWEKRNSIDSQVLCKSIKHAIKLKDQDKVSIILAQLNNRYHEYNRECLERPLPSFTFWLHIMSVDDEGWSEAFGSISAMMEQAVITDNEGILIMLLSACYQGDTESKTHEWSPQLPTALHYACQHNAPKCLKFLLHQHALVQMMDYPAECVFTGIPCTPLMVAAKCQPHIVPHLLEAGVSYQGNKDYISPVHMLCGGLGTNWTLPDNFRQVFVMLSKHCPLPEILNPKAPIGLDPNPLFCLIRNGLSSLVDKNSESADYYDDKLMEAIVLVSGYYGKNVSLDTLQKLTGSSFLHEQLRGSFRQKQLSIDYQQISSYLQNVLNVLFKVYYTPSLECTLDDNSSDRMEQMPDTMLNQLVDGVLSSVCLIVSDLDCICERAIDQTIQEPRITDDFVGYKITLRLILAMFSHLVHAGGRIETSKAAKCHMLLILGWFRDDQRKLVMIVISRLKPFLLGFIQKYISVIGFIDSQTLCRELISMAKYEESEDLLVTYPILLRHGNKKQLRRAVEILQYISGSFPMLKQLCRQVILNSVRYTSPNELRCLHLPDVLTEYIIEDRDMADLVEIFLC